MTEEQWLAATDPQLMLAALEGKASDRKLRLFACGCCRLVWYAFSDSPSRKAVAVAERYADGLCGLALLRAARRGLGRDSVLRPLLDPDAWAAACQVPPKVGSRAVNAAVYPRHWSSAGGAEAESREGAMWETEWQRQRRAQAGLLRDIFLAHPVRVAPAWLRWNNHMAVKLARDIYRGRAFYRLPVLADALEEAGCHDAEILSHLRGPGPQVRGCWAVDAVLGRG